MNELPATRHSLIKKLRSRSEDAWAEFLGIYEQAIYGYCRARGLQDADARDVTQDVLTAVDARVGKTWVDAPSRGKFRSWLFRVARNKAVDRYHEIQRRSPAAGESQLDRLHADDEQESAAIWAAYRRALMQHAAERVRPLVKESSWLAFWRTAIDGQTPEQVAADLGMTVGGVYTAKCRVLARIKKTAAELEAEDE